MIALNIMSLGGNIMLFIAVYRKTRLRSTTNIYIITLAISDLLSAIFVMPFATGVLISGKWPFGKVLCQVNALFSLFAVYASPVTMGLTAVNRYMRICKSDMEYKRFFSPIKSCLVLAFVWGLIAGYILLPRLAGVQRFQFVPEYAACLSQQLAASNKIAHFFVIVGLFSLLPLAVTIFSYRKVSRKIQEHNINLAMTHQRRDVNFSAH